MIVVLNGTSSSGKSTIARAFQEVAPRRFLNFSIDSILYTLPPSVVARMETGELTGADINLPELVQAFCACVSTLAALGHDLVIDHAITTREQADLLLAATAPHPTLLVAIDCPPDVLAERERTRANRRPGLAAAQLHRLHQFLDYDLRIDSSRVGAEAAGRTIVEALERLTGNGDAPRDRSVRPR